LIKDNVKNYLIQSNKITEKLRPAAELIEVTLEDY
jgi:hypothetical protein